DKAERLGAGLAYYAAFSMAPLLVIVVALVDFFYSGDSISEVQRQLGFMIGEPAADAVVTTIRGMNSTSTGMTATIISVITLFIGSTGVFAQLQDAMNTIWEVTPKPRRIWADFLRSRIL